MKRLLVALAMFLGLVPTAAEAYQPQFCLTPDLFGPIVYDFKFGPGPGTQPTSLVDVLVDDVPAYSYEGYTTRANWIERVDVAVDGTFVKRLNPATGSHRRPRQRFSAELNVFELGPGLHTLTFSTEDVCGLTDKRDYEMLILGPGMYATCQYPLEPLIC